MFRTLVLSVCAVTLYAQAFEVASIRVVEPPYSNRVRFEASGSRVRLRGYSVRELIEEAWSLRPYQVSLAAIPQQEKDIRETIYDIAATTPGEKAATRDEIRKMIQALLAERFHLAIHREMKEMPVYALVQGVASPTLKVSTLDIPCSANTEARERYYVRTFANCPIATLLAHGLESVEERPVVDRTGLKGSYDFQFVATPSFLQRDQPGEIDTRSALQKLGLRLESRKEMVEAIAITKVGKPTAN